MPSSNSCDHENGSSILISCWNCNTLAFPVTSSGRSFGHVFCDTRRFLLWEMFGMWTMLWQLSDQAVPAGFTYISSTPSAGFCVATSGSLEAMIVTLETFFVTQVPKWSDKCSQVLTWAWVWGEGRTKVSAALKSPIEFE